MQTELGSLLARLGSRLAAESRIGSAESRAAIQEASRAAAELLLEASTTGTVLSDLLESVRLGSSSADAFIAPPAPGRQPMATASVAIHFANIPQGLPGPSGMHPPAAVPQPAAVAQPGDPGGATNTRAAQFFVSSQTLPSASACMPFARLRCIPTLHRRCALMLWAVCCCQRVRPRPQCSARARCLPRRHQRPSVQRLVPQHPPRASLHQAQHRGRHLQLLAAASLEPPRLLRALGAILEAARRQQHRRTLLLA